MKTTKNSAGAPSCEEPCESTTTTILLLQLTAQANQWLDDGKRLLLAGDFNSALVFFRNGLAKAQAAGESELEAELHNSVACALSQLGDQLSAKAHYMSAVAILERLSMMEQTEPDSLFFSRLKLSETQQEIHALAARKMLKDGTELLDEGCLVQARRVLEEALPFAEHGARDPLLEAELLNQLAFTYARDKKYKGEEGLKTAVSLCKQALSLVEPHIDRDQSAEKLIRTLDRNLSDFEEALQERPVWQLIEAADRMIAANVYEHAEAEASQAVAVCRKKLGADHPAMAYALNRVGFSQLMMQDFTGAAKNLRAASVIISKWPKHSPEARLIAFSLLWAESEGRGVGDWGILPPEWR